jgi:16S rRNA (guanine966-N2)-methyltransferase
MPGLRVISGKARGFRLRSVPGDTTRPITDRVKEALFNIIGPDIVGSSFLDLFAGSGSVGIEALSRGAALVVFIDINRLPIDTVRGNLKLTGLGEKARVLRQDAYSYLADEKNTSFDYIFIAPPQYKAMWKTALLAVDDKPGLLSFDGWVIVQIHPVEEKILGEGELKNLEMFERRNYGSTAVLFFHRK